RLPRYSSEPSRSSSTGASTSRPRAETSSRRPSGGRRGSTTPTVIPRAVSTSRSSATVPDGSPRKLTLRTRPSDVSPWIRTNSPAANEKRPSPTWRSVDMRVELRGRANASHRSASCSGVMSHTDAARSTDVDVGSVVTLVGGSVVGGSVVVGEGSVVVVVGRVVGGGSGDTTGGRGAGVAHEARPE